MQTLRGFQLLRADSFKEHPMIQRVSVYSPKPVTVNLGGLLKTRLLGFFCLELSHLGGDFSGMKHNINIAKMSSPYKTTPETSISI